MEALGFNHAGYLAHLTGKRLMAARCTTCGALHLPPRTVCSACFGSRMAWQQLSGEGTLLSFTLIHVGLPGMAAEGYSAHNPYCSGIVRLKEGPAISAQIVGVDPARPEEIRVGMTVASTWIERGPGREVYLGFAPAV